MDQGGCRLNGGGGHSQGSEDNRPGMGSQSGMITLEDLESFSEDQLSDSGNGSLEEGETMEEDDDENQDRLLHYWQDVARGHRVEVPGDMAEPIQQLTSNNNGTHTRERVPFSLITRKEKCGDVHYEKRHYEKAYWACITVSEETYEQSICYGFMRIMRYICQQNATGNYLGMTLPIVTVVRTDETRRDLVRSVTVGYFLPERHQAQPPRPMDSDITIEEWSAAIIYSRAFTGPTNEVTIMSEIQAMAEALDTPDETVNDTFIIAGYTNPAHANRQNEIWFMEKN